MHHEMETTENEIIQEVVLAKSEIIAAVRDAVKVVARRGNIGS
jgi:hypothetical protein